MRSGIFGDLSRTYAQNSYEEESLSSIEDRLANSWKNIGINNRNQKNQSLIRVRSGRYNPFIYSPGGPPMRDGEHYQIPKYLGTDSQVRKYARAQEKLELSRIKDTTNAILSVTDGEKKKFTKELESGISELENFFLGVVGPYSLSLNTALSNFKQKLSLLLGPDSDIELTKINFVSQIHQEVLDLKVLLHFCHILNIPKDISDRLIQSKLDIAREKGSGLLEKRMLQFVAGLSARKPPFNVPKDSTGEDGD